MFSTDYISQYARLSFGSYKVTESPYSVIQDPMNPLKYNRYTYVMNNPLKYTDPSGYVYRYNRIMWESNWHAGAAMDHWMRSFNNDMIARGVVGGGFVGNSAITIDLNGNFYVDGDWVHPNYAADVYGTTIYESLSIDSNSEGLDNLVFSSGTDDNGRALGQFRGFSDHFFDFEPSSGLYYLPGLDIVINPTDVLTGKINWYDKFSVLDFELGGLNHINQSYAEQLRMSDIPIPHGNSIEKYLIPAPPIYKAYKTIKAARAAAKSLGTNPFAGKSFKQIDRIIRKRGFSAKGPDPLNGKGSYFSPSGTRYWFDSGRTYKLGYEGPHVDIWYNGHPSFEKVKLFLDGSSKMYTLN